MGGGIRKHPRQTVYDAGQNINGIWWDTTHKGEIVREAIGVGRMLNNIISGRDG